MIINHLIRNESSHHYFRQSWRLKAADFVYHFELWLWIHDWAIFLTSRFVLFRVTVWEGGKPWFLAVCLDWLFVFLTAETEEKLSFKLAPIDMRVVLFNLLLLLAAKKLLSFLAELVRETNLLALAWLKLVLVWELSWEMVDTSPTLSLAEEIAAPNGIVTSFIVCGLLDSYTADFEIREQSKPLCSLESDD